MESLVLASLLRDRLGCQLPLRQHTQQPISETLNTQPRQTVCLPLLVKFTSFRMNPPPALHISASALELSTACCPWCCPCPNSASVALLVKVHILSHLACQLGLVTGMHARSYSVLVGARVDCHPCSTSAGLGSVGGSYSVDEMTDESGVCDRGGP